MPTCSGSFVSILLLVLLAIQTRVAAQVVLVILVLSLCLLALILAAAPLFRPICKVGATTSTHIAFDLLFRLFQFLRQTWLLISLRTLRVWLGVI